ncbi:ATP-binding cassette domain-containing protein, partial [bacterium]|nr:ATP-binding cassette domain-containing protein [bacterium]
IERYARDTTVDLALMDRSLDTFSGGERAAAAALVALVASPDLLIADEPLGGLDARSAERLALTIRESRATRVIAAHDVTQLNAATAQHLRLEDGNVVATPATAATVPVWNEIPRSSEGGAPVVQLVRATAANRTVGPSSLAVMRGATTLLTGDTGSGKSTLLHLVAGTLSLDAGERIAAPNLRIRCAPQDSGLLLGARPGRAHIAASDASRAEARRQIC